MIVKTNNIFALLDEESEDDYMDDCANDLGGPLNELNLSNQEKLDSNKINIDLSQYLDRPTEIRKYFYLLGSKLDRTIINDVWESWIVAMPSFPKQYNDKLEVIKEFVMNLNQKELIIYDCPSSHRYKYHQICGLLRLEHKTLDIFANNDSARNNPNLKGVDGYKPIICNRKNPSNDNGDNVVPINIVPKTMIISKPENWSWEFTAISNEQEQLNQTKIKERDEKNNLIKSMKDKQRCADNQ
jgi:hypothetical protein